jgi:uncharacterized repeat protein (TIGR01451 family)
MSDHHPDYEKHCRQPLRARRSLRAAVLAVLALAAVSDLAPAASVAATKLSLRAQESAGDPHLGPEVVDEETRVRYQTYVTTCPSNPECVRLAERLTLVSRNIAIEEANYRRVDTTVTDLRWDIEEYTEALQQLQAQGASPERVQEAQEGLDELSERLSRALEVKQRIRGTLRLLDNLFSNLRADLEACEATCESQSDADPEDQSGSVLDYLDQDPHQGPLVIDPSSGIRYHTYRTTCPSWTNCRDLAEALTEVSHDLADAEERLYDAEKQIPSFQEAIDSGLEALLTGSLGDFTREEVQGMLERAYAQLGQYQEERDIARADIARLEEEFQALLADLNSCEAACEADVAGQIGGDGEGIYPYAGVQLLSSTHPLFTDLGFRKLLRENLVLPGLEDPLPPPPEPVDDSLVDLIIQKSGSPDPVQAGGTLTYTISVNNGGPDDGSGVRVIDTLPVGVDLVSATSAQGACDALGPVVSCDVGNLASDTGAVEIEIVVSVREDTEGSLTNLAEVSGNQIDPDPATNSAVATTEVTPAATPTQSCALNIPPGAYVGNAGCGLGTVQVTCAGPTELIIKDGSTLNCDASGNCGDNNTIFNRSNHLCRVLDPSGAAFALFCEELDNAGQPTGAQCREEFSRQGGGGSQR